MKKIFYYKLDPKASWTELEFETVLKDHAEILDILGFLGNTFYEKKLKLEPYKCYIETFVFKQLYQSLSLHQVLQGTIFTSNTFNCISNIYDTPSSYVLMRALFENYLTFNYLFLYPRNEEERVFKWELYKLSSLTYRSKIKPHSRDMREKQIIEKKEINRIFEAFKENKYFIKLSSKQRESIIKNSPARISNWGKLFEESCLRKDIFYKLWKLCSNHAHSEYISLIQFKEIMHDTAEQFSLRCFILYINTVLSSIFIKNICSLYKEIEENFITLKEEQKEVIQFLSKIGMKD